VANKLVAGAGYGGYERPARVDETWFIHWVRGPRTARLLGLDPSIGLGDPASLIPLLSDVPRRPAAVVGFMPHFESLSRGHWAGAARLAGIRLIDPRGDPAAVLSEIAACRIVASEALHGVIAADALRVPWIAVRPFVPAHRPKWLDWGDSLNLRIAFRSLPASSWLERAVCWPAATSRPGRYLLGRFGTFLHDAGRRRLIEAAAAALHRLLASPAQLSADRPLDAAQDRMRERIEALRRDPFRTAAHFQMMARRPSLLRVEDEFAYQPASTG
jgi:succinoglycan biosynthesis protein ExoV